MIEAPVMAKAKMPEGIPESEVYEILRSTTRESGKHALSTHISPEAYRILKRAGRKYGVNNTKALEIIVRQWLNMIDE